MAKRFEATGAVYDDRDELEEEESHTSVDNVLRTLPHFRHVQSNDHE